MIDISGFRGEIPAVSPKLLPDNYAVAAVNCDFASGVLKPIKGVSVEQEVSAGAETIYRLGEQWLEWNNKIRIIESLVYNSGGRIIFTGDNYPKETNAALALSSAPYPTNTRRLGISAPATAPDYSIVAAGTGTDRDISYCYTRVGLWEDGTVVESAPSLPTDNFTAKDDATVRISGFTDAEETGTYTTHYRIYRVNPGNAGAEYQYVGEIEKTVAPLQYDDTTPDNMLGEVLPTVGWTAPIEELKGIISTSNGLAFGFNDNTVYPSESFIPYTFPVKYSLSVASEIVGLGFNGNAVVVLTKTFPFLIYGSEPESLSLDKRPFNLPCKSARSIVSVSGGVIFASSDGLFLIDSGGNATNLTKRVFTKSQWEALEPEQSFAFHYKDAYIIFFAGTATGIEVDVEQNHIRRFELDKAVYGGQYVSTVSIDAYNFLTSDGKNFLTADGYQFVVRGSAYSLTYDTLYLVQSTESARTIVSWDSGSLMEYTWKSKEIPTVSSTVLTAGMVMGDFTDGNVTLNLYVNDTLAFSRKISNEGIFRVSNPIRGTKFQVEVAGKATIHRIIIGASAKDVVRRANG